MDFSLLKPSKSMAIFNKAKDLKKQGIDIISFGAGDTHFPPPPSILNNLNNPPLGYSHYTISKGIEELRDEIAKKYNTNSSFVSLTNGVKQGLFYALQSLEEDTVCFLEPAWLGYQATATMCNKKVVSVNIHKDNWLEQLRNSKFGILILCSPNNPDGKVFTQQEINEVISICNEKNAWIIFDNIYAVYDYSGKYKLFDYDKLIIAGGFSKSHAVTGFRIGYLICEDKTTHHKIDLLNQNIATCAPAISQYALLNLSSHNDTIAEYVSYYKENRDLISQIIPEFEPYKPDGAFYYFIDVSKFGFDSGEEFCNKILDKQRLALIPGSAYGNFPTYVRMSFSIDRDILLEGLERIKIFCKL